MPITAFSKKAARELDLEQWLKINAYQVEYDAVPGEIPSDLRARAALDIECSCCGASGATLVRGAHSKGTRKAVAQGHFRFRTAQGESSHHQLCDFFDEQNVQGTEYLANFASDKSALTRAIRDLVCRGIAAGLFTQSDMRSMRLWFLREKAEHTVLLSTTPEDLQWCVEMQRARAIPSFGKLPFIPEHGLLPGFDWKHAARLEWVRRNEGLFAELGLRVHFQSKDIGRPLRLLSHYADRPVLDPSALREKYEMAVRLASFAAGYLLDAGKKAPVFQMHQDPKWGSADHALLALSALLLFVCEWDIGSASALFCRVKSAPSVVVGDEGNLIGLNPFHDYLSWLTINAARRVVDKRTDCRPVSVQVAEVEAELIVQFAEWSSETEKLRQ